MLSIVKSFCDLVIALGITGAIGFYSLQGFGSWIKKEALTKTHQGLPSLSRMTENMTCRKFDKNMNFVKSKRSICRRGK